MLARNFKALQDLDRVTGCRQPLMANPENSSSELSSTVTIEYARLRLQRAIVLAPVLVAFSMKLSTILSRHTEVGSDLRCHHHSDQLPSSLHR
ncbi:hypothetical protein HPP92_018960 [Vanilla planifolia]|uniref:Uncharacterized protein n=1 Tax=Vanilla planifolia TaxID=51239 RepID=A0A835Q224_VANPL|nr:hypothetical protein HPP92_019519 [Vanilla planifolia]KAG0464796.1 hypothetical protein HPP92_018960 [Vanilla planifolia]